jgi:acyl carrier protein
MANTISSRTPEGFPNHCPVCDADLWIKPSQQSGDAPCPNCGHLLWFIPTSSGWHCYEAEVAAPVRKELIENLCALLGVNKEHVNESTSLVDEVVADSLDIVELMMDAEEACGVTIPYFEAEKIKTVGDLLDCIIRYRQP